jgi:ABC-type transporter Mla MlaB component
MLKIATRIDPAGPVTLALAGSVSEDSLGELERTLDAARQNHQQVQIDLSEVTLLDPHALHFLITQRNRNVELVNCPEYIEPWLYREVFNHSPE